MEYSENPFEGLSFVTGPNIWAVQETGDWGDDNRAGARYAGELICHLRRNGRHKPLLGHIVRELVRRGKYGAIEIGFFHRLVEEIALPSS